MKSLIKKGIFIIITLVGLAFFWFTYEDLKNSNDKYLLIKGIDEKVIEKLVMARELQVHYMAVHGEYASEWDSLFSFVRHDSIYMVQHTENIIKRDYGGDSVFVQIDTIGVVSAYDSLRNKLNNIPLANIETIKYAPGHSKDSLVTFFINAGKIKKNHVFEVYDPKPLNPIRQKPKKRGGIPPLKIGSMQAPSLKGNWEY